MMMKKSIVIIFFSFAITGCDELAISINGLFFPDRDHVFILEPDTFSKISGEYIFTKDVKPIIRDEGNSLCFVLAEGYKSRSDDLERVKNMINSIELVGKITLENDTSHPLKCVSSSWKLEGEIFKRDEFSACLLLKCNMEINSGKTIEKIIFTSRFPVEAKGLYWTGSDSLKTPSNKFL